jgi:hypothetical protein
MRYLGDRSAGLLAAVRYGMPVVDVHGAFLGRIEHVGSSPPGETGDPQLGLKISGTKESLLVEAAHIAYVTDDHIRLSITADRAIGYGQSTAGM